MVIVGQGGILLYVLTRRFKNVTAVDGLNLAIRRGELRFLTLNLKICIQLCFPLDKSIL